MFIFFSSLILVATFGLGVYFADVVKRYLKKGLNLLIGEIDNTPKSEQPENKQLGVILKTPIDRLTLYKSHKEVLAYKVSMWNSVKGGYLLIGNSDTHAGNTTFISSEYMKMNGISIYDLYGYVVVYLNDENKPYYVSFSPSKAFELGYSKSDK